MRRWLKQGGADPDRDVRIVVLPPTQMAGSLRAGLIDGYCVGEPWNSVAVADGTGWCPATSEDLAANHPEKALLTTEEFSESNPVALAAVIRALHEACAFCDDAKNRVTVVDTLLDSGHMRTERSILKHSLIGPFDNGVGERRKTEDFHIFHRRDANVPSPDKAEWIVGSFLKHGLVQAVDAFSARRAMNESWRPDLFHAAIGATRRPAARPARRRAAAAS
jgi:NitT/TauT family transport system ATP-binding protein